MDRKNNRMAPENWQAGDLVQLSCFINLADGTKHPNCGQICRIVTPAASDEADMLVEFESDENEGRSSFLILPRKMFLPIPAFLCETWSRQPGHTAWRVNELGRKMFSNMDWPSTAATFGEAA